MDKKIFFRCNYGPNIFCVILLAFHLFTCRNSSDRIEKNSLKVEKTDSCIQKPRDSTDSVVKAEDLTEDPPKAVPGSDAVEIASSVSHAERSPKIESKNDTAPKDSCSNSSAMFESKRLRSQSPQIGHHSRSPTLERSHDLKPLSDNPLRSPQSSSSRSSQREKVESRAKTDHRSDSKESHINSCRKGAVSPSSSRRTSSRESSRNRRSPSHRSSSSRRANSSTNRSGNSDRSVIPKNKDDHKSFYSEKGRSPKKAVAIVPPRKRSPVE